MSKEHIEKFIVEGIFSKDDKIRKLDDSHIPLEDAWVITKEIGKENPFSFVPMVKGLSR